MDEHPAGFDDLRVPFVFVPDGAPVPWDWMAGWTDIVRVPATLVLRHAAKDAENREARLANPPADEHLGDASHWGPVASEQSAYPSVFPDSAPAQRQYRSYVPRAAGEISRERPGGSIQVAALGDLRCEGFPGGCSNGGSYGTTATFEISGSRLCQDCAVKILGIQDEPAGEKTKALRPYLMNGR